MRRLIAILILLFCLQCNPFSKHIPEYEVKVIGGGASGTMAGLQSARLGTNTLIIEGTSWLGGMLTSAGVSAIDGNYNLNSGLWHEFRNRLYDYYEGEDSVKTGWVSNILFEPDVGARLLSEMAAHEKNLKFGLTAIFWA